ncbi:MAG: methyltransferase domain-containing protein [Gammaproteobacteria bacterium]|nr:methyltransferase domain-containing protein [Gammaproteobacteria bacterium]MDH3464718.1 methyltransferase domain-containing protein [Gammaproteobacteria bacterium]
MTDNEIHYPDEFADRLEILWGEGFLSPGGVAEVEAVLKGIDLANKLVLDIGCGTGGAVLAIAREHGAGHVTGIDVEPQLIDRAQRRISDAGVADRVDLQLVEPGPLNFQNDAFDVVFSKDSIVHIPDKDEIFREIFRVLRPGGVVAASDWLVSESADASPEWVRFCEYGYLSFAVATAHETETVMSHAGFEQISTVDRNAWYAATIAQEVEQLEGPLRARVLEVVDKNVYEDWMDVRRALRDAVGAGALRPTHVRGYKPDR